MIVRGILNEIHFIKVIAVKHKYAIARISIISTNKYHSHDLDLSSEFSYM